MKLNHEAERLCTRTAAEALRDYHLTGPAFRQEVEALARQIAEAISSHLDALGLEPAPPQKRVIEADGPQR